MLIIKDEIDILCADEQTIVCTTNIVGAMGRGIAFSVKMVYPNVYKTYRDIYESGNMTKNTLVNVKVGENKYILLFPTKIDWRKRSETQMIIDNLDKLYDNWDKLGITTLAMPPLGMVNGWLRDDECRVIFNHIKLLFDNDYGRDVTFYMPPQLKSKLC